MPRRSARAAARSRLHALISRSGIDLVPHSSMRHPVGRRMLMMRALGIDLVLDVGANSGQFGREIRRHGYQGRIVSFEPLDAPYRDLARLSADDPHWDTQQVALSDFDGTARMNVAANAAASSSLLAMLPLHDAVAPDARYVGAEEVRVQRLDAVGPGLIAGSRSPYLKIDVQGTENRVISGAAAMLALMSAVQLELSLFSLYDGAPLLADMLAVMANNGFRLAGLEPGLTDHSDGRLLQADGLFIHAKN